MAAFSEEPVSSGRTLADIVNDAYGHSPHIGRAAVTQRVSHH
jgi:hypothetical protein